MSNAIQVLVIAAGAVLGVAVTTVILLLAFVFAMRTIVELDNRLARVRNKRRHGGQPSRPASWSPEGWEDRDGSLPTHGSFSPDDNHAAAPDTPAVTVDDIGPEGEPMIHIDATQMRPDEFADMIVKQAGLSGAEGAALYRDMMQAMRAAAKNGHESGTFAIAVPIGPFYRDSGPRRYRGPVS